MSALTLIFEELCLRNRAGTEDCVARVCSSWAEAAAAATVAIELEKCSNIDSLQQWLHSRGSGVRKIKFSKSSGLITSLPCPKLEGLEVADSSADLRPGSQLLRDLCAATALTTLRFSKITFQDEPDLAPVLLALPNLQEFRMFSCYISSGPMDSHAPSQQLLSTYGDPLDGVKSWTDTAMQLFCKLTKLQLLHLCSLQGVTAAGLADLADLPGLQDVVFDELNCDITLSAVPAFSQLTALTALTLTWVGDTPGPEFDPSILAHMTQLELLELHTCTPARGTTGAAELLFGLSQLPQLKSLALKWIEGLQDCPPEAFSGLTSSSVLESLNCRAELEDW